MAKRSKGKVGVIGLGIMGSAFARNLAAGGWQVFGYDIDPSRCRIAARSGVAIADGVKGILAAAPVTIASLPSASALAAVVDEMIRAKAPPRIVVETSTLALEDKIAAQKKLRRAGHIPLDCPISGTGAQAAVKDLVVYASGDRAAIRKLLPLFAGFARQTHDLGVFGNGSRMKYVANLLVAIHNVAAAEAMVLGIKAGLDPKQIFRFATAGAGNSRMLEMRGPLMVANDYSRPTMRQRLWQKDMAVIGDFAAALGIPVPLFSATLPVYAAAMATGYADADTASVCAVLEKMAGVRRRKTKKNI